MSNRLGIAQEMRLRTYELLKGQPASAIRKSLGLRPDECPHAALEAMRLRLERDPDPRPDVSHRQLRALKKGYNRRLINFLTRHYKSGEPLPNMPTIAKKVKLSQGRVSNITTLLQEEGRLEFRIEGTPGRPIRYVERWEPPA